MKNDKIEINNLSRRLYLCYSKDVCYSKIRDDWNENNKYVGMSGCLGSCTFSNKPLISNITMFGPQDEFIYSQNQINSLKPYNAHIIKAISAIENNIVKNSDEVILLPNFFIMITYNQFR